MRTIAILVGLLGCGSRAAAPPEPPRLADPAPPTAAASDPELTPALAPVAWVLGDWESTVGSDATMHWRAAGGAIYGVLLKAGGYNVAIIDDGAGDADVADGTLRLMALGDGHKETLTEATLVEPDHVVFGTMDLAHAGDEFVLRIDGHENRMRRAASPTAAAPALEAADLAFNDDTRARGIDGWLAAFAPDGAQWSAGARHEGAAAIRAAMTKILSGGVLAWAPIASGGTAAVGFTIGTATYTPTGAAAPAWRSSYVTIWKPQPDGSWKVAFDTGRGVHELAPAPAAAATGT